MCKHIHLIIEIVSELQKLFHHNENKKKLFLGWSKSVFGPKTVFLCENNENIDKVTSGTKIIFGV
jgi:hypothetical protein